MAALLEIAMKHDPHLAAKLLAALQELSQ